MSLFLRERCGPRIEWLEWISGAPAQQIINTGTSINFSEGAIECEWMLTNTGAHINYAPLFGNYISETTPCFRFFLDSTDDRYRVNGNYNGNQSYGMTGIAAGVKHKITLTGTSATVDSATYSITRTRTYTNDRPVLIGGVRDYSGDARFTAYSLRFYSLRILNGATVLRDFAPCRLGGSVGLYDRISEAFFGNVGVGSFTAGPRI